MDRRTVLVPSSVGLVALMAWWVGILYLDGALAVMMPYELYETVAILYPDVYYPALPGWVLASAQPFSMGVVVVTAVWMIVLSLGIGAVAVRYGPERGWSPNVSAAGIVAALFVLVTVVEAAVSLVA